MAKRLSADEWTAARLAWESDPNMTMGRLAEVLGITKQSVHARMKKDAAAGDPWEKQQPLSDLAARAQRIADRQASRAKADEGGGKADDSDQAVSKKADLPEPPPLPDADTPVNQRAEVISRHRREWAVVRGLSGEAIKGRDFERAKLAKITSETLKIMQDGERKAWGLDALDPEKQAPVVVIERNSSGG